MPLYDWGSASLNQQHYGQSTPPNVDLGKIKVPVAMFVGTHDELGDPKDNQWAKSRIKTVKYYHEMNAGHLTFLIGKDMSYFSKVLDLVGSHLY